MPEQPHKEEQGEIHFSRATDRTLVIRLAGSWRMRARRPPASEIDDEMAALPELRRVKFDTGDLDDWDTAVLTVLGRIEELCRTRDVAVDREGLPAGVKRLLDLADAVPEKEGARRKSERGSLLERIGNTTLDYGQGAVEFLSFIGQVTLACVNLLRGRARYRNSDLFLVIQECGAQALPIVTLISFLVGLILAFVGSLQLQPFGASIYVANLVGLGMVREMGAMMTAIIMSGRTGAAFAAQLGTMKVTQETDALRTMGISPMEFLVLPRMIALCLMLPLLCLYSDFIGMLGGAVVGIGMLDLRVLQYYQQTAAAMTLTDFSTGIVKSAVFGVIVAVSGCLRGMQCGSSSSAVGDAATQAVVTSIVLIVVADGLFAVIFNILGV